MYTSPAFVFGAIMAFASFATATPPACLLGALQVQTNPSDIKSLCGTLAESMKGNITEKCSRDAAAEAKKAYADTCLSSASVTITFSSSSSSSSGSATKSSSSTATGSDSASATTTGSSTRTGSSTGSATVTPNAAATTTGSSPSSSTTSNAASGLTTPDIVKAIAPIVAAIAIRTVTLRK
ncbi:hypothetical protein GLAREA_05291 [Glarea lozoyensis ATCC 20868]|uniref:GPI anchored cell wall protein n=1 Tax=Glarea lozoyensis (strain ATCC 20868 / MF5171) TaxID=1116229 RepID=S3ECB6_GLAL2|nr:uncharacterized protein GLAREA_05291 [Glarea lozoyensis ATCC 20868]EPE35953.1 hypothetical protein GLAREA_05291 [Glarea lozoyensis ATCC 20868]